MKQNHKSYETDYPNHYNMHVYKKLFIKYNTINTHQPNRRNWRNNGRNLLNNSNSANLLAEFQQMKMQLVIGSSVAVGNLNLWQWMKVRQVNLISTQWLGLSAQVMEQSKAFILRTMRGDSEFDFHGDWSENSGEIWETVGGRAIWQKRRRGKQFKKRKPYKWNYHINFYLKIEKIKYKIKKQN